MTTDEHKEQARDSERIKVCVRAGKEDWIGVAYAPETADPSAIHEYVSASALAARDAEVREVLEGLSYVVAYDDGERLRHWCGRRDPCTPACEAARRLYAKLQPR